MKYVQIKVEYGDQQKKFINMATVFGKEIFLENIEKKCFLLTNYN